MSDQSFEASAPSEEAYIEPASQVVAPVTRKQGMNIYTVMLLISFLALLIGTILLFIEQAKFGGWDTGSTVPAGWIDSGKMIFQNLFV